MQRREGQILSLNFRATIGNVYLGKLKRIQQMTQNLTQGGWKFQQNPPNFL